MDTDIIYNPIGAVAHVGGDMISGHYIYTDLIQNPDEKGFLKMGKVYDDSIVLQNKETYTGPYKQIKEKDFLEKNAYLILCKRAPSSKTP